MKAATCVLLACFTATVSAQEQKAAGQGAIQEVLIPWSNELPENWQKENEHGYASFEKGKKESYGNTLRITMGHSDLAEHLVEDHGCPAWVAELYKNDPKSLSRMHEGFMLKSKSDRLKADYDRHMKIKRREPGLNHSLTSRSWHSTM